MKARSGGQRAKFINIGDTVERITGVYAGLVGRVVRCKPRFTPWATHIKVEVDMDQFTGRERDKVRLLLSRWNSVASWKVIDE